MKSRRLDGWPLANRHNRSDEVGIAVYTLEPKHHQIYNAHIHTMIN